jgi:hypothetical protein
MLRKSWPSITATPKTLSGTLLPLILPQLMANVHVSLRSESDPYLGLVDCAKRIIDEEGIRYVCHLFNLMSHSVL